MNHIVDQLLVVLIMGFHGFTRMNIIADYYRDIFNKIVECIAVLSKLFIKKKTKML